MTSPHVIALQSEKIVEISLVHVENVGSDRPALPERTVQDFTSRAGEHLFDVSDGNAGVDFAFRLHKIGQRQIVDAR